MSLPTREELDDLKEKRTRVFVAMRRIHDWCTMYNTETELLAHPRWGWFFVQWKDSPSLMATYPEYDGRSVAICSYQDSGEIKVVSSMGFDLDMCGYSKMVVRHNFFQDVKHGKEITPTK